MRNIVVCDSSALLGFIVRNDFVVVFGVLGYHVPGVNEAREVAEDAEKDID